MEDGSTISVSADGRDIRAWEAANGASFLSAEFSYTLLTELAGYAAVRTGKFDGDLAGFMAVCVNVSQPDDDEPGGGGDPTPKGRGDEQSSPSRSARGSGSASGRKPAKKL
jgi:hypothetical protein